MRACVRARVCVFARVRVRVRACVRMCVFTSILFLEKVWSDQDVAGLFPHEFQVSFRKRATIYGFLSWDDQDVGIF